MREKPKNHGKNLIKKNFFDFNDTKYQHKNNDNYKSRLMSCRTKYQFLEPEKLN